MTEIVPLTSGTWPALAALFSAGGDPKWCWCAFWRVRGLDWSNSSPESNRALLRRLAGRRDIAPGLVAFRDGRAIGWVSLGPREDYERLAYSKVLAPIDDKPVWSIVCFVVARTERRKGVAEALLGAAVDYARDHGATLVEAYPIDPAGHRVESASAYTGTLSMFERAGFDVAAVRKAPGAKRPRSIVRRAIRRRPATRRRPASRSS